MKSHFAAAVWVLGAALAHPGNTTSKASEDVAAVLQAPGDLRRCGGPADDAVHLAVAADAVAMPVLGVLLASIELHAPRSFVHVVTTSEVLEQCHALLARRAVAARCVEWSAEAAEWVRGEIKVVSGANTAACAGMEGCDGARARRLANVLNFARFHLAELLPELDRVIWMDCDVIVRGPLHGVSAATGGHGDALLSAFAEPQRFGRFYLDEGGVARLMESRFDGLQLDLEAESFNDGVISINLKRWRAVGATKALTWLMSAHRSTEPGLWKYGTQPVMMLLGSAFGWRQLDETWYHGDLGFRNAREEELGRALFLHFDGERKPWKEGGLNQELWRPYANHAAAGRCDSGGAPERGVQHLCAARRDARE
mmetsp:Transcript_47591/g.136881  ORF Transcript_47591/g.136881 Transcript_47591/m.136881 type:complete len:369 (-) Transcript_47591:168-1274(-)